MSGVRALSWSLRRQVKRANTSESMPPTLDDDSTRRLLAFKEKAIRKVRSHVLLIAEDARSEGMKKLLQSTSVSDWVGETITSHNE